MSTTENKLQHDFSIFQINFPYTRLMRYENEMVYSPKGENVDSVLKKANEVIADKGLNLVAEKKTLINFSTIVVKEKNNNNE